MHNQMRRSLISTTEGKTIVNVASHPLTPHDDASKKIILVQKGACSSCSTKRLYMNAAVAIICIMIVCGVFLIAFRSRIFHPTRASAASASAPTSPTAADSQDSDSNVVDKQPGATVDADQQDSTADADQQDNTADGDQQDNTADADSPDGNATVGDEQSKKPEAVPEEYDNIIMIVLDQLRYDTVGYAQAKMPRYEGFVPIRTPHLDNLAQQGAIFTTAYSQSVSCAPSRGTLKTGCTVARHGVTGNALVSNLKTYEVMDTVRQKIESITTLEEILHDSMGYRIETYGKWHFPQMYFHPVSYNYFDYDNDQFGFTSDQVFGKTYINALRELSPLHGTRHIKNGDQYNAYSSHMYTPVYGDPRYRMPTNTSESTLHLTDRRLELGIDSLSRKFTSTAIVADMGIRALNRLLEQQNSKSKGSDSDNPSFMLSFHFNAPHPPRIATAKYVKYYRRKKNQLWSSPSLYDPMTNSAYRSDAKKQARTINETAAVAEMTAVYYAMIEEVDTHIGRILDRLQEYSTIAKKTLILVTGDHGELLGSHGMTGKGNFYEESVRVPMILVHSTKIQNGIVVKTPVSHLDVVSTLLDYAGVPNDFDTSDGTSLRRFIERTSFNQHYDEEVVVSEHDTRKPITNTTFSPSPLGGSKPCFMVRRGLYKFLTVRDANQRVADVLYDLRSDPFEMDNLLVTRPDDESVIGTAEHLRVLLLEWMKRHDGENQYFSSNRWNAGVGRGDIGEISSRRVWKRLPTWQSATQVQLRLPVTYGPTGRRVYRRVEYLYMGGPQLSISNVTVKGTNASLFSIKTHQFKKHQYYRIRVSFKSKSRPSRQQKRSFNAALVIASNNTKRMNDIPIVLV